MRSGKKECGSRSSFCCWRRRRREEQLDEKQVKEINEANE